MESMKTGTRFTLYGIYEQNGLTVGAAQVREKCAPGSHRASIVISDTPTGDTWPASKAGWKRGAKWTGRMNQAEACRIYGADYVSK